ncbi:DUF1223 domain-containing protein [Xinfangfangia sp. CPCC 101601]|uniref:DUF1223 domain-containing protein n=1 Tax=Pseudogemmobacter lacusdianii TaxID=3069608 RepID=A0ABU0VXY9_9RHOB|nr:DUF1223 domain-containing protein [Xinfangfangia sp. CPCC 101601]MDQ2066602.1 DUF1223 domain-containing protein [Xinfangfangia sp. CPCC 101601]
MRHIVGATCGLWVTLAAPLLAEPVVATPVVVVELFTSQGCASCPPADALVEGLAQNPQILPLSLHVDYWDYIGWADKFADPAFTARQKAYARANGSRMIYTPQMIVAGQDRVEGYDPDALGAAIAQHVAQGAHVALRVQRQGDVLLIEAQALTPLSAAVQVQLVRYKPAETVQIERGENAGQVITYRNIVTTWDVLGDWAGDSPLSVTTKVTGEDPAVVILQDPGPASILAAAQVN